MQIEAIFWWILCAVIRLKMYDRLLSKLQSAARFIETSNFILNVSNTTSLNIHSTITESFIPNCGPTFLPKLCRIFVHGFSTFLRFHNTYNIHFCVVRIKRPCMAYGANQNIWILHFARCVVVLLHLRFEFSLGALKAQHTVRMRRAKKKSLSMSSRRNNQTLLNKSVSPIMMCIVDALKRDCFIPWNRFRFIHLDVIA